VDNKSIAGIFYETADLMEIDGQDSFRIRSYRNAAEAIEALPQQISELISEPKQVLAIPGIGKGMLLNLQEMFGEGRLSLHADLLKKYRPSMLQLLKVQGLGPKTIGLIWSAYQVCDLEGVEQLAREGKIRILPRMGEKHEQKLLKAIEDYRRIAGRFLLEAAETQAAKIVEHLKDYPGVEKATPAGSLRRGRETVGDLDILVTGPACCDDAERQKLIEHIIKLPGLMEIIARGENKVSFRLRGGMQVDCAAGS
jgi:DNA polymerase (family 10)